ncbi:MAG: hypothetical protein GXY50_10800 [Syntrophomonadaceae bacterium]|nr:hypothetical protein [Syntrophomonadaceae bacterium]
MKRIYLTLAGRIRNEISEIEIIIDRIQDGWKHISHTGDEFYLDSVVLINVLPNAKKRSLGRFPYLTFPFSWFWLTVDDLPYRIINVAETLGRPNI